MGKRKRGIGCKENESTSVFSICPEDTLQDSDCKRLCLASDVPEVTESSSSDVDINSLPLEPAEGSDAKITCPNELPASDARPTLQLRTSVRVQNKRKEENKCEIPSEALAKKGDICSQDEDEDDPSSKPELLDGEGKKRRRAWEVWSMEDKNVFFEGINECGKDFEAIQNFLMTKMRRRGNVNYVPKNKDQVRHFYYRTWHKISKYVIFNLDVKKATQELYGLINYGELRRKVGGTLDEKKGQKLQELIEKGSASLRLKGKSIRVRTPICRALKKLNQFTDDKDHGCFRVPSFVTLQLSAGNVESWSHVQSLAHNPRVRIKCPLHKQLSSIFSLFEHKWRSQEVKMCERLASSLDLPVNLPTVGASMLRLRPEVDVDIKIAEVQADTQMTSSLVSLASHEHYLENNQLTLTAASHRKVRKRKVDNSKCPENRLEIDVDSQDDGSDGEFDCRHKSPPLQGDPSADDQPQSDAMLDTASNADFVIDSKVDIVIKDEPICSPEVELCDDGVVVKEENEALRQLRALQNVTNPHDADGDVVFLAENTRLLAQIQAKPTDGPETVEVDTTAGASDEEDVLDHKTTTKANLQQTLEQIRKGWTSLTCGSMKIGDLYLMFGKKKTLSLEYIFEDDASSVIKLPTESVTTQEQPNESAERADDVAPQESSQSPTEVEDAAFKFKRDAARKEFSEVLERLFSMVKSFGTKTPAGDCFLCGASKSSTTLKSPANSRSSAYGKSPGHTRSPRVASTSKSPKTGVTTTKVADEKTKPASAKRLLACIPEEAEDSTNSAQPKVEDTSLPSAGERPIQPKLVTDSTGGFRVPLAPAPRVASSTSGFNAQLSKLLPKYSRPRRTGRKNMFIQRQLPLLPTTAKNTQGFITLKVLPQPGVSSSNHTQEASLMPTSTTVIPLNVSNSSPNPYTNPPISMPIISAGAQPLLSNPTAISVNVSGQQLLTVQMPAFTAPPPCSVNLPDRDSNRSQIGLNSLAPIVAEPISSSLTTNTVPMPISAFQSSELASSDSPKVIDEFGVEGVLSKQNPYPLDLSTPPSTPQLEPVFAPEDKSADQITCSTPTLPELRDISFLEMTPFSSPAKLKFSLSPLNLHSDGSNLSMLNTPKQPGLPSCAVSPIKLSLSAILNSLGHNRMDVQENTPNEPAIPEIHIPETSDSLPMLDMSLGGTLSVSSQPPALTVASTSNFHLKMASAVDKTLADVDKEKKISPTKMMDITFANSNSNSSFSTLLAAVGQAPPVDMDTSLTTPPRSTRPQPSSVTKKDSNAPFGLSFGANLFASDYASALPTTTPSPPSSPSRLLQHSESSQWLNNEMNDFSLSTLLSHLESPTKVSNSGQKLGSTKEDSCSLSCFLGDNSVDFAATFATFKAQIAKDNRKE